MTHGRGLRAVVIAAAAACTREPLGAVTPDAAVWPVAAVRPEGASAPRDAVWPEGASATDAGAATRGVLAEASCAGCHVAAAEEWRGSMHHASFTSGDFQRSYRAEPRAYCVACHAPLADTSAGIGCTACHDAPAEHAASALDAATEVHGAARRARVTTKDCTSCHDFAAPGSPTMLQATAREHEASAYADRSCADCHMRANAGGSALTGGHRFDVTRNRDFLARAIRVQHAHIEAPAADAVVVVRVAAHGVGHRFPTGDLFRRVTATVVAYDGAGALVGGDTFYFRRDLDAHRASLRAHAAEPAESDTRLDDAPRDLRIATAAPPTRVHVTVRYERGAAGTGDDLDTFAEPLDLFDADVPLTPAPD